MAFVLEMRNLQRVFAALCGIFALGLGIFGVLLAGTAPRQTPVLLDEDPGILECAEALLESVSAGDFNAVSERLVGTPALVTPDGDTQGVVWKAYVDSMTYQIDGPVYGTVHGPALDVTLEALDINRLCDRVEALVPTMLERQISAAQDIGELYDSQNGYRQEVIDRVLLQALTQALQENPASKETRLTLHFACSDGLWQVQPESRLVAFLSGNITGA